MFWCGGCCHEYTYPMLFKSITKCTTCGEAVTECRMYSCNAMSIIKGMHGFFCGDHAGHVDDILESRREYVKYQDMYVEPKDRFVDRA